MQTSFILFLLVSITASFLDASNDSTCRKDGTLIFSDGVFSVSSEALFLLSKHCYVVRAWFCHQDAMVPLNDFDSGAFTAVLQLVDKKKELVDIYNNNDFDENIGLTSFNPNDIRKIIGLFYHLGCSTSVLEFPTLETLEKIESCAEKTKTVPKMPLNVFNIISFLVQCEEWIDIKTSLAFRVFNEISDEKLEDWLENKFDDFYEFPTTNTLMLERGDLSVFDTELLLWKIKKKSIKALHLHNCLINVDFAQKLNSVRIEYLEYFGFTVDGSLLESINLLLSKYLVMDLRLAEVGEKVTSIFRNLDGLSFLFIKNNKLEDLMIENLDNSLSKTESLELLDLSQNRLTGERFGKGLQLCRSLRYLILDSNPITHNGLKNIAKLLKDNLSVQQLSLKNCRLDYESAKILGSLVSESKSLEVLSIEDNQIGENGLLVLLNQLKGHESIQKILVRNNKIDFNGSSSLARKIRSMKNVSVFGLRNEESSMSISSRSKFKIPRK